MQIAVTQRICSVEDCSAPIKGRGLCSKHIQRLRKYGTTDLPPQPSRALPCALPDCPIAGDDRTTCHFPECGRPYSGRGLCNGHLQILRRGDELRPLKRKSRPRGAPRGLCAFVDCGRKERSVGLCYTHYGQLLRGEELRPLKVYKPGGIHAAAVRDDLGRKLCPTCDEWKPESEFHKASHEPGGRYWCCKACGFARHRANVLRRYSMTLDEYDALLAKQGGTCAICHQECPRGHLSVDHNHKCCPGDKSCGKCVRGLLCRTCNQALGNMRDDPAVLRAAAAYLEGR